MQIARESNAGRASVLEMDSLSEAEIQGTSGRFIDYVFSDGFSTTHEFTPCGRPELADIVVRGGMPKMQTLSHQRGRTRWVNSYLHLVLEDIRDIYDFGDETGLKNYFGW